MCDVKCHREEIKNGTKMISYHSTHIRIFASLPRVSHRSIANRHVNRRLYMYANRKLRSSKLFHPSRPSYTPCHMLAESRPLYPLFRLITPPLRLQRRYHADPLPTGMSIVVYICMPIANYAVSRALLCFVYSAGFV